MKHIQSRREIHILDLNDRNRWEQAHVPGARSVEAASFTQKDLPADKQAEIVFYCSNPMCRKAPNAARKAEDMGYENIKVMRAGISGWQSAGMPVEMA